VEALGGRAADSGGRARRRSKSRRWPHGRRSGFGRIDILINNAGALWWQPLLDTPPKRFDLVMGVTLAPPCLCSRAFLQR